MLTAQPFGVARSRQTWNYMIQRYGELALLRQPGLSDRWIFAIVAQFTALERMGGISNPADRKAIVSTISPDTGLELTPDPSERDIFVALAFDDNGALLRDAQGAPQTRELLKIIAPPTPVGNTSEQLYWKLQVRA